MIRDLSGGTVNEVFRSAVQAAPDRLFLDFSGRQFTYGQLDVEVDRLARGLQALGVGRGDRVATMLDNEPDAVISWFAINRLGAVNVPVNTAYKGEFLRHQMADAGAVVSIVEADFVERVRAVWDEMPQMRHLVHRDDADDSGSARISVSPLDDHRLDDGPLTCPDVDPSTLATLLYTSGTTGASKGCRCSHNYFVDQGIRLGQMAKRTPDELNWTPLPLFHIFGVATVLSTALLRGSAAFAPRFSVSEFWPEVQRTGAAVVSLLGSMAAMLANALDNEASERCRGQIRALLAVPMGPELRETWRKRFGVTWAGLNAYGQTEAGCMITAAVDEKVPDGSSGRRNDTLDVRVVDDNGTECEPGEVGEVVVRPLKPHVMFDGYWNQPVRDQDRFHHTGDYGKFDEEGYFYFVDRKSDYLRRRGENISSVELENSLLAQGDLAEVAVHAVASELTEDDVKATVVRKPGSRLTAEELIQWAVDRVPYFALPRYVEFRSELPKNPVGRVLKYQLRDEGVTSDTWDRESSGIVVTRR